MTASEPKGASQSSETPLGPLEKLAPPGSSSRALLRVARQMMRDGVSYSNHLRDLWDVAKESRGAPDYTTWLGNHRLSADGLIYQTGLSAARQIGVRIHFVVRAAGGAGLERTLDSLVGQTMRTWSATVVGADAPARDRRIAAVGGSPRDVLVDVASSADPYDFVLVLDAGDRLEPDFVFELAARAWDNPFLAVLHWDDDVIDRGNRTVDPRFRPSWSPEMLLSANYLGRSFAVRCDRIAAAALPAADLDDAAWWDLLLRLGLTEDQVGRVPRVVHHLVRRPDPSPAAGVAVLEGHLASTGRTGQVSTTPAGLRVTWELTQPPHVSVIIPTRHNRPMLSTCLPSLAKTDYPSFDVVMVDNGEHTPENEAWYANEAAGLDLTIRWWDRPFNYSAVNNEAAAVARGDVLVFLNDDTELIDPLWLRELVSWVRQPDIGLVGVQLTGPDGEIQHGGVILGMSAFADHLFAGCHPGDDTLIGSTLWYRDSLSVTAACVAVERSHFEQVGGFDERLILTGSDVVLGLDMRFLGLRNVVTPFAGVRHLESATRGTHTETSDFPTSYWHYQCWLRGGDPYYSPNLSLLSTVPTLRRADEPSPLGAVGQVLNRNFTVFRQRADEAESRYLAKACRADEHLRGRVIAQHEAEQDPFDVHSVNWFVPDVDNPYYGGINTAFRIADHLTRHHGVENRFVVTAAENDAFIRSALTAAFPRLADSPIEFLAGDRLSDPSDISPADVSIATQWVTAYSVAHFRDTRRRFYLIQDFEPVFYPAGTNYALAEETYRLGLYGICNTERLLDIYRSQYGGQGMAFMPAVDQSVFHAHDRKPLDHGGPATIFLYARPGHWRNCWEIASLALEQVKQRLGQGVRIVTAGSWAQPEDLGQGVEHLGLLDYRDTGKLYRTCDSGIALTLSAHPSYLPLELMACGTPVVAFDNPAGDWILHQGENALRCPRTVDGLAHALIRMATDGPLRQRLGQGGLSAIAAGHSDWEGALDGIFPFLCSPDRG